MSSFDTIKAAYAAFAHNDPSVLFGVMDPGIVWNEAEGNPLADRNPYVGPQAVGEGVEGLASARGEHQLGALGREHARRRGPDAGGGSGDQHDLVEEASLALVGHGMG